MCRRSTKLFNNLRWQINLLLPDYRTAHTWMKCGAANERTNSAWKCSEKKSFLSLVSGDTLNKFVARYFFSIFAATVSAFDKGNGKHGAGQMCQPNAKCLQLHSLGWNRMLHAAMARCDNTLAPWHSSYSVTREAARERNQLTVTRFAARSFLSPQTLRLQQDVRGTTSLASRGVT